MEMKAFMDTLLDAAKNGGIGAAEIYYSDEYIAMESFPGETSVQMIDGIIYVKTEDAVRD